MTPEERASLVKRLRSRDAEDVLVRDFKATADLIEADGKRLALADAAPHGRYCSSNFATYNWPCDCWKAEYDAAKEGQ